MNSKAVLVRRLVILGIVNLVFLAGCNGGAAPIVNNPPPPSSAGLAIDSMQGLAQTPPPAWAVPGAPLLRPGVSFGITLSLRRHPTLNRTLLGWFFGVRRP